MLELFVVAALLHHVVSKTEVYLLDTEMAAFSESLSTVTYALFIAILCLLGLL